MKTKSIKKSKLIPTLSEAFEVGKREGLKQGLTDIQELVTIGLSDEQLKSYLKSRISILNTLNMNNPFK